MRVRSLVGLVVALAIGATAGAWAGDVLLRSPPDVLDSPDFTVVEAEAGTVERSFRLNASAEWQSSPVAANLAAGTVTSIDHSVGKPAEPGDILFRVDLRPVVVAEGSVPAFRELSQGARGDDVAQLQALLIELGYYVGEPTGHFTSGVSWAVKAWQRDLGVEADGVVRSGDIVFLPELPVRLVLDDEVAVGRVLAGGEPVVLQLDEVPSFTISLPDGHAQSVQVGQYVEVEHDRGVWDAEITAVAAEGEADSSSATLRSPEGDGPLCDDECDAIPLGEPVLLPSRIHVVPETSGVTVPTAAIVTDASGATGVLDEAGQFTPAELIESASGMAVVEGIDAGTRVRVPGDAQP